MEISPSRWHKAVCFVLFGSQLSEKSKAGSGPTLSFQNKSTAWLKYNISTDISRGYWGNCYSIGKWTCFTRMHSDLIGWSTYWDVWPELLQPSGIKRRKSQQMPLKLTMIIRSNANKARKRPILNRCLHENKNQHHPSPWLPLLEDMIQIIKPLVHSLISKCL